MVEERGASGKRAVVRRRRRAGGKDEKRVTSATAMHGCLLSGLSQADASETNLAMRQARVTVRKPIQRKYKDSPLRIDRRVRDMRAGWALNSLRFLASNTMCIETLEFGLPNSKSQFSAQFCASHHYVIHERYLSLKDGNG
jgi:hypothetical protein